MKKVRLDILLSDKFPEHNLSRSRASALIMGGKVFVSGKACLKSGSLVDPEALIEIKETTPYVSRGGIKLKGALESFGLNVRGLRAIDIGASTGGFTDCLLKEGVDFVYCVDVGYGQLDYSLRNLKNIKNIEKTNIKNLGFEEIGERLDLAVCDTSFISLKKVLPFIPKFIKDGGLILALIKPQFETEDRKNLKKGIIKDEKAYNFIINDITLSSEKIHLKTIGVKKSCLKGKKGNTEFFVLFVKK